MDIALALLEDKQSLAREDCNVPKNDMHANPKRDTHANPKSDMQTLKVTCMASKNYLMMHASQLQIRS